MLDLMNVGSDECSEDPKRDVLDLMFLAEPMKVSVDFGGVEVVAVVDWHSTDIEDMTLLEVLAGGVDIMPAMLKAGQLGANRSPSLADDYICDAICELVAAEIGRGA